jgi:hypothetical protein
MSTMIAGSTIEYRRRAVGTLRSVDRQDREARGVTEALALMEDGEYRALRLDCWLQISCETNLIGWLRFSFGARLFGTTRFQLNVTLQLATCHPATCHCP